MIQWRPMIAFFRRAPDATEILATALGRRDYTAAATMVIAGSLETLRELKAAQPALSTDQKRTALTHALASAAR